MREIAFDTETTGLDPNSGHRIVEIGCVEMIGKIRTGKSFQRYLNPERDVPEEVVRVHGLTTQFLKDKPIFAEVVEDMLEFIGDSPLVIHNAAFDLKFINHELKRLGFGPIDTGRDVVDTAIMARRKYPGAPASLDALCRRFEIDLTSRTKHGALLDSELLADVYLELCGGRQAMIAFEAPKLSAATQDVMQTEVTASIPAREFPPTDAELAAHQEFVGTLKNPIWAKYLQDA